MQPLLRVLSRVRWSSGLALLGLGVLFMVYGSPADVALAISGRSLTLDDRVACQQIIEAVTWQYRIWPKENPQPKPALDEVRPLAAIRAKVEDDLRQSQALAAIWGRPLTAGHLQREIDRMARDTKQPDRLRAVWAALGNDPFLVAECLARPSLANRLIRSWYAREATVHEPLAHRVRQELERVGSVHDLKQMSGEYAEAVYIKDHQDTESAGELEPTRVSDEEWRVREADLRSLFGGPRGLVDDALETRGSTAAIPRWDEAIPVGVVSRLDETGEAYREKTPRRMRLATRELAEAHLC